MIVDTIEELRAGRRKSPSTPAGRKVLEAELAGLIRQCDEPLTMDEGRRLHRLAIYGTCNGSAHPLRTFSIALAGVKVSFFEAAMAIALNRPSTIAFACVFQLFSTAISFAVARERCDLRPANWTIFG
ncbi:hypothetical protein [Bradyrhizobium sp. STM 3561]|uniref:hypothetical protein n=1 Tax=unclassified Bradyrhizobium TaxID=2631580 RepID=UPI00388FEDBA